MQYLHKPTTIENRVQSATWLDVYQRLPCAIIGANLHIPTHAQAATLQRLWRAFEAKQISADKWIRKSKRPIAKVLRKSNKANQIRTERLWHHLMKIPSLYYFELESTWNNLSEIAYFIWFDRALGNNATELMKFLKEWGERFQQPAFLYMEPTKGALLYTESDAYQVPQELGPLNNLDELQIALNVLQLCTWAKMAGKDWAICATDKYPAEYELDTLKGPFETRSWGQLNGALGKGWLYEVYRREKQEMDFLTEVATTHRLTARQYEAEYKRLKDSLLSVEWHQWRLNWKYPRL